MKCKREATFANLGPFEDVRKLSATDNESLDMFPPAPLVPRLTSAVGRSDPSSHASDLCGTRSVEIRHVQGSSPTPGRPPTTARAVTAGTFRLDADGKVVEH